MEHVVHGVGERGDAARRRPVRELRVAPEELEDAHEVGLPRAVEAADPRGGLGGPVHVLQVGVQDGFEAAPVLALADESRELVAQDAPLLGAGGLHDLGDPVIRDAVLQRVAGEDVAVYEVGHGL